MGVLRSLGYPWAKYRSFKFVRDIYCIEPGRSKESTTRIINYTENKIIGSMFKTPLRLDPGDYSTVQAHVASRDSSYH